MKKTNKFLLVIITLCAMSIKTQTTKIYDQTKNDHEFTYKKSSDVVKLWKPRSSNKILDQEKKDIRKFLMQPSRISTLLALFTEYDQPNHGYLTPKYADLWKIKDLFTPQNIRLDNTNRWVVKFRSTPPFCNIEPIQQKINC